jgi:hypothetical protein
MRKLFTFITFLSLTTLVAQHDSGIVTLDDNVTIRVQTTATDITITATGPSDRWFGIGFGTSNMASGDCLIFGDTGLSDRHFVGQSAPSIDTNQWTVSSNTVTDVRTIMATRVLNTGESTDFVFTNSTASIPVVWARHSQEGYNLIYHGGGNRGSSTVPMALSNELFNVSDFSIYPNPAVNEINVSVPQISAKFNYAIYEVSGKLMLQGVIEQADTILDVSSLSAGAYVIHLNNEEIGSASRTFIKK